MTREANDTGTRQDGLLFLFPPRPLRGLVKGMPFSAGFLRFVCVAESLGAVGLMPVAGGAVNFRRPRGEVPPMAITAALFALAAFVAYARWFVIPL